MTSQTKQTKSLSKRLVSRGYSRTAEIAYRKRLLKLVSTIKGEYVKTLDVILEKPGMTLDSPMDDLRRALDRLASHFGSLAFEQFAIRYASEFVDQVQRFANKPFDPLGLDVYSKTELKRIIKASTQANVQLIKGLTSDECNALANLVYTNIQSGKRATEIIQAIKDYGVSDHRAKVIARDQTSKVQGAIARSRMVSAGYEYFRWETSEDERVRPSHRAASNKRTKYGIGVYRFDDPPVVDGEKALPSQPIMCRCVAIPVDEDEVEAFQQRDNK